MGLPGIGISRTITKAFSVVLFGAAATMALPPPSPTPRPPAAASPPPSSAQPQTRLSTAPTAQT